MPLLRKTPPYGNTKADPDRTVMQIGKLLQSYGVTNFQWTNLEGGKQLKFLLEPGEGKRPIGIRVTPPAFVAKRKTWNPEKGRHEVIEAPNWAQSLRLLYYWLKVKLESVAYGLREAEEEWLADTLIVVDGREQTVGELLRPALADGSASSMLSQLGPGKSPKYVDVESKEV
jgi:hypothetical protein